MIASMRRRIDPDPIMKSKQAFRSCTLPDQRIERRDQRLRIDATWNFRIPMKIRFRVSDHDRHEVSCLDQFSDSRTCFLRSEPKIIPQIQFGANAKCARRDADQFPLRVLGRRGLYPENFVRNYSLN